ncbi:MAG: DinB family protein [Ktedonobacterales bacterium]
MSTSHNKHAAKSHEPPVLSRRDTLKVAGVTGLTVALLGLGHMTPALAEELTRLAHGSPMTGARLADILRTERTSWNGLLAQVRPDRMEIPGAVGEWSVKELVAHLTWYERAVLDGAQQVLSGGTFTRRRPDNMDLDDMNSQIAAESRARPVSDVLAEADDVFGRLLTLIAACPQDILNDSRLLGLPDDIPPWMRVANNSYAHYREHEADLRAWLATQ